MLALHYLLYSKNKIHDTLVWGVEGTDWVKNEDGTGAYPQGAESAEYHMADFLFGDQLTITPWQGSGADLRDTKVANQVTACQSVANEYKPMLSAGVYGTDTEAKYEEFMAALERAGMKEILAEYQSQLDDWLAAQ